jgi:hypothetical protein
MKRNRRPERESSALLPKLRLATSASDTHLGARRYRSIPLNALARPGQTPDHDGVVRLDVAACVAFAPLGGIPPLDSGVARRCSMCVTFSQI